MEVAVSKTNRYQLPPLVSYDVYDDIGFLLDIRQGILVELNERDTLILSTILHGSTLAEVASQLKMTSSTFQEAEIVTLLERLQGQKLLEIQTVLPPCTPYYTTPLHTDKIRVQEEVSRKCTTLRQRIISAGHIICVLNTLHKNGGFYKAYQYIHELRERWEADTEQKLSIDAAFQLIRSEYWYYRLITGLIEYKIAHLLGQHAGDEGLCMVRSFALCAYLLSLGIPAQIIIARPKYGQGSGFKLHVWVEVEKKPVNEQPNVAMAYRIMTSFPAEQ
jgi:hypothetical protein